MKDAGVEQDDKAYRDRLRALTSASHEATRKLIVAVQEQGYCYPTRGKDDHSCRLAGHPHSRSPLQSKCPRLCRNPLASQKSSVPILLSR